MAAILEKLLARDITPEQLISWLQVPKHKNAVSPSMTGLETVRCEFVPYFLNYLRDQCSHLLQNSKSANTTPAKTPTTAKLRRLTTRSLRNDSLTQTGKRQQLFSLTDEMNEKTSDDQSSYVSDHCNPKIGNGARKQLRNKTSGKSQRSIQFTDTTHKAKHKTSLGDFLKSPDLENRLRMNPVQNKWDSYIPHGPVGKRQLNKNRSGEKKQRLPSDNAVINPAFSLNNENEFPPMSAEDRFNGIPDGATVITPSRRIVPTRVASSTKAKDNQLFKNAPVSVTGSSKTRGVWGQVANRDFSQQNVTTPNKVLNKPHRRIVPTFITSQVTASTDGSIFSIPATKHAWENCQKDNSDGLQDKPGREERPAVSNQHTAETSPAENEEVASVKDLSFVTPTKPILEKQLSVDTVTAEKDQVTHVEILDLMITVYSFCINAFLVPNITLELYFLVQLLTAHGTETEKGGGFLNKDLDEMQYFVSVHNAVYFAVMVIANITSVLSHLDRGTLHLLADNQRIRDFNPELRHELQQLYNLVPLKTLPKSLPSPVGGVSFQADTDNRKNFPNERSFHLFKKQRDGFYELIREWEDNHLVAGWSMQEAQGERIQNLVGFKAELANHIHFVRLFQSQLIQMCKGDSSWEKEEEDENIALLSELKQTNPKKLKRLRERLVTPALHGGPCPAPSFPGCQEFFKDFISAACNPFFNQLLSDQLLHKINEVNEVQFVSMDVTYEEEEEVMIDTADREMLLNCILTSKLLAKFLGFVSFLPYSTPEVLPEGLLASYISMRDKSTQPVDIKHYILEAYQHGHTVLTVPWAVEYISMIDPVASQLKYFQEVFSLFLNIYRETSEEFQVKHTSSHLLILTVLGWLFELPWFPEGHIFTETCPARTKTVSRLTLDYLNIVDQHILYSCCPYLGEVKSVLVDFAVGVSGRCSSVRKITPISTDSLIDISTTKVTDKQLQHQLEDNFFHNQPASLKKTIEFVADRVSSNHIKIYRTQILPQIFTEAQQHVQHIAEEIARLHTEPTGLGQKEVHQSVENRASELATRAKALCLESAPKFCSERCQDVLSLLLPDEMPAQVWKVSVLISYRQALEKVNSWLNMQITTHMFKKELLVTSDLEKKVRNLTTRNHDNTSNSIQTVHDLSADVSTWNQLGSLQSSNQKSVMGTGCKSLMFESPIRSLQQVTYRSKESTHYVFQPVSTSQLTTCSSPFSNCIRNLSSFDKEPSFNMDTSIKILSAQLSELGRGEDSKGDGCSLHLPGSLLNSDSLLNSSHRTERRQFVSEKCLSERNALMKEKESFLGVLNEPVVHEVNKNSYDTFSNHSEEDTDLKEHDAVHNSYPVCDSHVSKELTQIKPVIGGIPVLMASDVTRESDSPGSHSSHLASDIDSSSTSSILSKAGSAGKKLNVSFYELSTACEDIEGISFIHSTPTKMETISSSQTDGYSGDQQLLPDFSNLSSPTELLILLKECLRCVIQEPDSMTISHIGNILKSMTAVFDKADHQVVILVSKMMTKLSVDLAFMIVIHNSQMMTAALQDAFYKFWQISDVKKYLDFSQLLCFRHLWHLKQGTETYVGFVNFLLQKGLLDMSLIASNANQLLDNNYPNFDATEILSKFMCNLLSSLPQDLAHCPKLCMLITRLTSRERNTSRKENLMSVLEETPSCQSNFTDNMTQKSVSTQLFG